jgi:hypothetical protein
MKDQIVLKYLVVASICLVPLAWNAVSAADEYRRGQFLGLDLSKAVLSPKRLGPSAEFVPDLVEPKPDREREREDTRAAAFAQSEIHVAHAQSDTPKRSGKRHASAHPRLARHHGNPLDAQAFDARIRAWPCNSGGICNWKRGEHE